MDWTEIFCIIIAVVVIVVLAFQFYLAYFGEQAELMKKITSLQEMSIESFEGSVDVDDHEDDKRDEPWKTDAEEQELLKTIQKGNENMNKKTEVTTTTTKDLSLNPSSKTPISNKKKNAQKKLEINENKHEVEHPKGEHPKVEQQKVEQQKKDKEIKKEVEIKSQEAEKEDNRKIEETTSKVGKNTSSSFVPKKEIERELILAGLDEDHEDALQEMVLQRERATKEYQKNIESVLSDRKVTIEDTEQRLKAKIEDKENKKRYKDIKNLAATARAKQMNGSLVDNYVTSQIQDRVSFEDTPKTKEVEKENQKPIKPTTEYDYGFVYMPPELWRGLDPATTQTEKNELCTPCLSTPSLVQPVNMSNFGNNVLEYTGIGSILPHFELRPAPENAESERKMYDALLAKSNKSFLDSFGHK